MPVFPSHSNWPSLIYTKPDHNDSSPPLRVIGGVGCNNNIRLGSSSSSSSLSSSWPGQPQQLQLEATSSLAIGSSTGGGGKRTCPIEDFDILNVSTTEAVYFILFCPPLLLFIGFVHFCYYFWSLVRWVKFHFGLK